MRQIGYATDCRQSSSARRLECRPMNINRNKLYATLCMLASAGVSIAAIRWAVARLFQ
jgi:hypothetical protein